MCLTNRAQTVFCGMFSRDNIDIREDYIQGQTDHKTLLPCENDGCRTEQVKCTQCQKKVMTLIFKIALCTCSSKHVLCKGEAITPTQRGIACCLGIHIHPNLVGSLWRTFLGNLVGNCLDGFGDTCMNICHVRKAFLLQRIHGPCLI